MRIRSTKPEFWKSRRIASVSWDARLVLKGLESYVDDNGVGVDDIELIVTEVFPRDMFANGRETVARVSEAISELHRAGLVHRYEANGERLLFIAWWDSIQRIDKPGKGRNPRPDGTLDYRDSEIRESVARAPEGVAPGTEEQGNRGTGEQTASRYVTREPERNLKFEANRIVNGWLMHVPKAPPPQLKTKILAEVQIIVQAGDYLADDIVAGLDQWYEGKYPPSTIGNYVMRASQGIDANAPGPTSRPKRATGEDRAADILTLQPPPDDEYAYPVLEAGTPEDDYLEEPTEWSTT